MLSEKKAMALALLETQSMFVHLDARRPGVVCPGHLVRPDLVVQIGLNMPIPITDLEVEDWGIGCTLSFSRRPFYCRLPWYAIYALIGQQQGGQVWEDQVPPEVIEEGQKRVVKSTGGSKSFLAVVKSSKQPRPLVKAVPRPPIDSARPVDPKPGKTVKRPSWLRVVK